MLKDKQVIKTLKNREQIKIEIADTDQILLWPTEAQEKLKRELEYLFPHAFPRMAEKNWKNHVSNYFRKLNRKIYRQVIFIRNKREELIASSIFDQSEIDYDDRTMKGIYLICRTVLPKYQGSGLGKIMALKVLTESQPDILFVTCYQSSSLHSWVRLVKKSLISDFEVYPRLEQQNGKEILTTVPYKELDFAINAFKQSYLGVVKGNQKLIDGAIRNLTVFMVRKNAHAGVYDFNPWEKSGRKDKLAKALGLKDKDGILVMFRKKRDLL